MNSYVITENIRGGIKMAEEKNFQELLDELKKDLDFLPPDDHVKDGFLNVFSFFLFL